MQFRDGDIDGVVIKEFRYFKDQRGWLSELFRHDELDAELHPVMSYISMTNPGVARGPHEHVDQTDCFVFFSSTFKLLLWDRREGSPTKGSRMALHFGADKSASVIVPPGVVHAYKNVGSAEGLVLNLPNRLYAGEGKKQKVDEIRYEDDPQSPYRIDG